MASLRGSLVPLLVLAAVGFADAQVPDHLKCYKVKDPLARATYVADIGGLTAEPGCLIRVPGKLLCVAATKLNVTPTPPGSPEGGVAGRFVCYKTKCPRVALPSVPVTDQFGTRTLRAIGGGMLCAPAVPQSTTTTTTCLPNASPCTVGSGPPCCISPCFNGTCIDPPNTTTTGPPCIPNGGACTIGSGPLCCQSPCTNGVCIHPPPTTTTTMP